MMLVEPPSTGQLPTDPRLARRHSPFSPFSPVVVSAMGSTEAAASGSTATGIQKTRAVLDQDFEQIQVVPGGFGDGNWSMSSFRDVFSMET
jgi:hypothetical protein